MKTTYIIETPAQRNRETGGDSTYYAVYACWRSEELGWPQSELYSFYDTLAEAEAGVREAEAYDAWHPREKDGDKGVG